MTATSAPDQGNQVATREIETKLATAHEQTELRDTRVARVVPGGQPLAGPRTDTRRRAGGVRSFGEHPCRQQVATDVNVRRADSSGAAMDERQGQIAAHGGEMAAPLPSASMSPYRRPPIADGHRIAVDLESRAGAGACCSPTVDPGHQLLTHVAPLVKLADASTSQWPASAGITSASSSDPIAGVPDRIRTRSNSSSVPSTIPSGRSPTRSPRAHPATGWELHRRFDTTHRDHRPTRTRRSPHRFGS